MDSHFLAEAIAQAKTSLAEGGIPIGAVLVCDGMIIGRGHNRRVQHNSVVHHAEINCFENAGHQLSAVYRRSTLYTTLSPCFMCAGAAVLLGVPRVVVGEERTIAMASKFMQDQRLEVEVLDNPECYSLLQAYIAVNPTIWNEDSGEH